LRNSIIKKYGEFDHEGHCYFTVENVLPFVNVRSDGRMIINFRDGKTGELVHILTEEKDFEVGECEFEPPYINIVLHFRSRYKYVIIVQKRD
jgi:hypothetical protein